MPIQMTDEFMSLEIDGRVVATACFSRHAAADSQGTWIVSCQPTRLFTRDQAIDTIGQVRARSA